MQFILADGTVVRSSYRFAYLVADYAIGLLRIISGQSWIPGLSQWALPIQARTMFRHANRVLDSAGTARQPGDPRIQGQVVSENETDYECPVCGSPTCASHPSVSVLIDDVEDDNYPDNGVRVVNC